MAVYGDGDGDGDGEQDHLTMQRRPGVEALSLVTNM